MSRGFRIAGMAPESVDVIVVGTGNAAMSAAVAARNEGARVLMVEKGPREAVGGNSFFAGGGFRFAYDGIDDIRALIDLSEAELRSVDVGSYTGSKYHDDLMRVTEGLTDPELAGRLVSESFATMRWMREQGMRWALMTGRQAFKVGDVYRFWGGLTVEAVGGGPGLIEHWLSIAEAKAIDVRFDASAHSLLTSQDGSVSGLRIRAPGGFEDLSARAVLLACGGFEANPEMRTRYLGQGWELAKVRGTRYNTGDGIRMALEAGAQAYGHWSGCHAVAWDANAPEFGNRVIGDLFQKHSYPLGIIVNADAKRFVDEGADFRNYTYAKYGREILSQPRQLAFQIFDEKTRAMLRDEYRISRITRAESQTIDGLAEELGLDPIALRSTVNQYNAACRGGRYDPTVLDGVRTEGLLPPKSNWALPIDKSPFLGFAVTCGITFTFGGLRIIPGTGQVLDTTDRPMRGLYAAGELVGGLFWHNYPGGAGLMAGAVFGRLAGAAAAAAAS
jgi:tricarballylate dehydrogenase